MLYLICWTVIKLGRYNNSLFICQTFHASKNHTLTYTIVPLPQCRTAIHSMCMTTSPPPDLLLLLTIVHTPPRL